MLKNKSFLKLLDLTQEEIEYLLDLSAEYKAKKYAKIPHQDCKGKNIVLLFEKASTRTRCSFEVASFDLGMNVTYLDANSSQMGKKESIVDTAKVLGRMYDAIEYRGYAQEIVEELAEHANVPVYNGLTNEFHPTQILADFLTIKEKFGSLKGLKMVYMGDARYNMGNSYMVGCAKMGMDFTACCPKKYFPGPELTQICEKIAEETGAKLEFTEDVEQGVADAHVVCTDVWVSMGEAESVWEERIAELSPYQVNAKVMNSAKEEAIFMHCLPAFHDLHTTMGKDAFEKYGVTEMEVTDEVFQSEQSVVFDEAENRMHTIKAIIAATLA